MRLLVTGGSGFLGRYVLDEAARLRARLRRAGAQPGRRRRGGGPRCHPAGRRPQRLAALPEIFASARCAALVNLASLGFGHAPAIVVGRRGRAA